MEPRLPNEESKAPGLNYFQISINLLSQMAAKLEETARASVEREAALEKQVAELHHLATHDSLTDGLNRQGLEMLAPSLKNPTAVLKLDLTNFKAVNDEYGHRAGDEMLRVAYFLILSSIRTSDVIGRWGGDEFVVILCDDEEATDENAVTKIADRDMPATPDRRFQADTEVARDRIATNVRKLKSEEESLAGINFNISVGATPWDGKTPLSDAVDLADPEMYEQKAQQHENGKHRAA